jgi:hypothetical protein
MRSQLEYYQEITKAMPGKVLARHGLVERNGNSYCLKFDIKDLTNAERSELLELCDIAPKPVGICRRRME